MVHMFIRTFSVHFAQTDLCNVFMKSFIIECLFCIDFTVEMAADTVSVDEGVEDGVQQFCVTLNAPGAVVECELTVEISPSDGTASMYMCSYVCDSIFMRNE